MKKYRVIAGSSLDSLEDQINDIMNAEGLEFIGGASASKLSDNSILFMQGITYDGTDTKDAPISKEEYIEKTFIHGVYEHDGPNDWNVLHMSDCEGGENCRLLKYITSAAGILDVELKTGYEYTVTEVDGKFQFEEKKLDSEESSIGEESA
jgi:hypothetical protein